MHKIISKLPSSFYQADVKNYKVGDKCHIIKMVSVSLLPQHKRCDYVICIMSDMTTLSHILSVMASWWRCYHLPLPPAPMRNLWVESKKKMIEMCAPRVFRRNLMSCWFWYFRFLLPWYKDYHLTHCLSIKFSTKNDCIPMVFSIAPFYVISSV